MNLFGTNPGQRSKYNVFDRSHEVKMSFNMGDLIPVLLEEVVPGDKFQVSSETLIRLAPMLAPMMHRVNVFTHYYYVPMRLVWDNYEKFFTGGRTGLEEPVHPYLQISDAETGYIQKGKLADYMGLPYPSAVGPVTADMVISALPFRSYQQIVNDYYRDPNLSDEFVFSKGDGLSNSDIDVLMEMRRRAWERDYFTSCLPNTQRGADALIPIQSNFKPLYKPSTDLYFQKGDQPAGTTASMEAGTIEGVDGKSYEVGGTLLDNTFRYENLVDPQAVGNDITVEDLRTTVRLQEWLEKSMRGGHRYIEHVLEFFGVKSDDLRLDRAEYLGGGRQPVSVSEVLNTSGATDPATDPVGFQPVGQMSGHGISVGSSMGFRKRFKEHGYVMGIMSVLPRTAYQQGIHKMWSRFDKHDYFYRQFANLGEQGVKNKEIFWDGTFASQNEDFGFQSRYAEYKFAFDRVAGDFRDNLKYWHMGREFDTAPVLNQEFVESDPTHRIFAVTDPTVHKLYCQIYNKVRAIRPMPKFNVPKL